VQASLAGFSIAAIGLMRFSARSAAFSTFADDLPGTCALVFLESTYLTVRALRARSDARDAAARARGRHALPRGGSPASPGRAS
jgi:hypothetical protein